METPKSHLGKPLWFQPEVFAGVWTTQKSSRRRAPGSGAEALGLLITLKPQSCFLCPLVPRLASLFSSMNLHKAKAFNVVHFEAECLEQYLVPFRFTVH